MTPALRRIQPVASGNRSAYSVTMRSTARSVLGHTRVIAAIVLTLTALVCVARIAHANMGTASSQDCFGPGCDQQITSSRPDQATAPESSQLTAPLATVAPAAIEVLPPQNQRMPATPALAGPYSRAICPLAPRPPPAR